jgi:DNA processing protein
VDEIRTITQQDSEYPALLHEIAKPPEQLYVRGTLPKGTYFAVVGTRTPTPYGKALTPKLTEQLACAGLVIVSGLAYGIDALAHEAALAAGGVTVAVLGTGVDEDTLYPRKHRKLARRIIESGGAVISEYEPGTPAMKHHFPARNRIVAGMSVGTLVVEAKEKSGALITAKLAVDENRDVFALPGSVTSAQSVGPNRLIQQGATPVLSPADILDTYDLSPQKLALPAADSVTTEAQRILDAIHADPLHIDAIMTETEMTAAQLLPLLTQLELAGVVRNLGGGKYARN